MQNWYYMDISRSLMQKDGNIVIVFCQVIDSKMQEIQAIMPYLVECRVENRKKELGQIEQFLVKFPLFMILREKKEDEHLREISQKIRIVKYKEGDNIYFNQQNRCFNLVIQGSGLLFIEKADEPLSPPFFFRKIVLNDYFGQRPLYNGAHRLHSLRFQSMTHLLELNLQTFYKAFQEIFTFDELKEKVEFLCSIWIFKSLKQSEVRRILLMSKPYKYGKNAILFEEDQIPQFVYVVVEGQLTLMKKGKLNRKYKSIMILGKGQICAWEQVLEQTLFQCRCVVTSSSAVLLKIAKQLFLSIFNGKVSKSVIQSSKDLRKGLIERNTKKSITFSFETYNAEERIKNYRGYKRRPATMLNKNNIDIQQKLQIANISTTQIDWSVRMKDKQLREYTLLQIQKKQKKKAKLRISTMTNSNFTNDKQLLVDYLLKKQRMQFIANQKQQQFRRTVFHLVPQLKIQRSTAVKNQMRKMKKSRRRTSLSLPNLCST